MSIVFADFKKDDFNHLNFKIFSTASSFIAIFLKIKPKFYEIRTVYFYITPVVFNLFHVEDLVELQGIISGT